MDFCRQVEEAEQLEKNVRKVAYLYGAVAGLQSEPVTLVDDSRGARAYDWYVRRIGKTH
jgi:hypothetical protein